MMHLWLQGAGDDGPEAWLQGGARDVANAALYRAWPHHASALSTASIKVDGSLVIAFLWEGRLVVGTRRRTDSEQVGC